MKNFSFRFLVRLISALDAELALADEGRGIGDDMGDEVGRATTFRRGAGVPTTKEDAAEEAKRREVVGKVSSGGGGGGAKTCR
mmetsp:Transcript_41454/g.125543  ORF Transcript_41454/g.125543 Transcript_41454/m.125543 type:complete len:83 (-) Transcript_41454:187-435(-)